MKTSSLMSVVMGFVVLGCAHGTMRGTVAMKISEEEAHVCMGNAEVRVGDKVSLFKNVCTSPQGSAKYGISDGGECKKEKIGEGEITRSLNEHYSVIKVRPGVSFGEGTIVEKI